MTTTSLTTYLTEAQEQLTLLRFRLATAPVSERANLVSQAKNLSIAIATVCYEYAIREDNGLSSIAKT